MATHSPETATNVPGSARKSLAVGGWALVLGLGLFAGAGVGAAVADALDAAHMPPAVIDDDGFQNYDTSSYPVGPSWRAGLLCPLHPSFPGTSPHPCCLR